MNNYTKRQLKIISNISNNDNQKDLNNGINIIKNMILKNGNSWYNVDKNLIINIAKNKRKIVGQNVGIMLKVIWKIIKNYKIY